MRLLRLLRRLRRDERGMALVMALGMMTVLGITVATVVDYTTANSRTAAYSHQRQVAYALADAGLNDAYGILSKTGNNAFSSTLLPSCTSPTTVTYTQGTASFCGSLPSGNDTWTITATGKVRNPEGSSTAYTIRKIIATVQIKGLVIQNLQNPVWNYLFATNTNTTGACDETLASGSAVTSNLYVYGNLCMNNSATITGAGTKLVVKGYEKMANTTNMIGTTTTKVAEAHIVGTCYVGSTTHNPCKQGASTTGDQIWATTLDNVAPTINAPTIDWNGYYNNANPGPKYPCYTTSGTVPVFDNDTTRNNSVTTNFDLTPSTADYNCWTPAGQIAWNHTTKVFTISGTVFIDGPAQVTCTLCSYSGRGVLYTSGTFSLTSSNEKFCGKLNSGGTDCDWTNWDPNAGPYLTVVAGGTGNSVSIASGGHFQAGMYGSNTVYFASTASVQGPVVGATISINGSMTTYPFNLTNVPSGVPDQPINYGQPQPPNYSTG